MWGLPENLGHACVVCHARMIRGASLPVKHGNAGTQFSPLVRSGGKVNAALYRDIRVTFSF